MNLKPSVQYYEALNPGSQIKKIQNLCDENVKHEQI
jgi:hypothetical protein